MNMPHSNRGVALVFSMIIMAALVAVGVSGATLALHTERQSSNAVQQATAFRAAEAGALEAVAALRQLTTDGVVLPEDEAWSGADVHGLGGIFAGIGESSAAMIDHDGQAGYWIESVTFLGTRIAIQARGAMFDGLGSRGVNVILTRTPGGLPGPGGQPGVRPGMNAVVACEGVSLQGSGAIRAVNSLDPGGAASGADVTTIGADADVSISGGTRIEGSVTATGAVSASGSSVIDGGASANGNISLSGGGTAIRGLAQTPGSLSITSASATTIVGGAVVGQNATIVNGQIHGDAYVGGNLSLSNTSARVTGNANVNGDVNLFASGGGIVDGLLTYGGNVVGKQNWQSLNSYAIGGTSNVNPGVTPPEPVPSQDCDPLGVPDLNDAMRATPALDSIQGDYRPTGKWNGARHNMTDLMPSTGPGGKSMHIGGDWLISSQLVDFPAGGASLIKVDRNFNLTAGGNLTIPPSTDITMVVDGDFTINGGTTLNIGAGSTLTLFLGGKMNVSGGGFIVQDGIPVISDQSGNMAARVNIFSDYDSHPNSSPSNHDSSGIRIGGNSTYHANIYAPLTDVSIMEGGTLNGAVWGQTVKVPGGAKINYDVALRGAQGPQVNPEIGQPPAAGPENLDLTGWQEL